MTKYFRTLIIAMTASSILTACGTEGAVGYLSSSNIGLQGINSQEALAEEGISFNFDGDFGLSALEEGSVDAHKPRGKGMGHKKPGGKINFSELNLTDEQKSALEALKNEMQASRKKSPENREKAKAIIDAAFVSETFDTTALKSELEALKPDTSDRFQKKAEMMVKTYQILTPEQNAQIEAKRAESQSEFESKKPQDGENKGDKRLELIVEKLGLSAEQEAAFAATKPVKPDFETMKAKHAETRAAIQVELQSESPSVDKIADILESAKPARPDRLEHLASIHAILTPEQRQKWVELKPNKGHKKMKRKGGSKRGHK